MPRNKKTMHDSHEHLFSHRQYLPGCECCVQARGQRKQHRKLKLGPPPKTFGKEVTGDHLIDRKGPAPEDPFFPNAQAAFVFYDRGTDWTECFPKGRFRTKTRWKR